MVTLTPTCHLPCWSLFCIWFTHTHTHIPPPSPQFVLDNRKGQKYLLGAFEILVGEVHPELLSRVPHILKAFYDNDILEEEAILEWADRVSEGVMRGRVCVCGGWVGWGEKTSA